MRPCLNACLQFLAAQYKIDMDILEKASPKGHEDEGTAASLLKGVAERGVSSHPEEKSSDRGIFLTYTIPLRKVQRGWSQAYFSSPE